MIKVHLKDPATGTEATVTKRGQLVTGPLSYSSAYFASASVNDTAAVLVVPRAGERFVMTGILLDADNGVSTNVGAEVIIYEAISATSTTATRTVLSFSMVKNSNRIITDLNLICTEGAWINVKTDDNTVNATMMGYYVKV